MHVCGALDNRRDAKRAPKVAAQADLREMAADRVPARGCAGQLICRYNPKKLSINPPVTTLAPQVPPGRRLSSDMH